MTRYAICPVRTANFPSLANIADNDWYEINQFRRDLNWPYRVVVSRFHYEAATTWCRTEIGPRIVEVDRGGGLATISYWTTGRWDGLCMEDGTGVEFWFSEHIEATAFRLLWGGSLVTEAG